MSFGALLEQALAGTLRLAAAGDSRAEEGLLRSAAYEGMVRLAARPLQRAVPTPWIPSEPETKPEIGLAAAERLREILDERRPELLREWLTLAVDAGRRVPYVEIPELLETARSADPALRELIMNVGGQRMIWLARLNPEWKFAAWPSADDQFELGTLSERVVALRRLRRASPAAARAKLESVWPNERVDARVALLGALYIGLESADEPLLRQVLLDSGRDIRDTAARLLQRLTASVDEYELLRQIDADASVAARLPSPTEPWSESFSRAIVARLPTLLARLRYAAPAFLRDAALCLDPRVAADGERLLHLGVASDWAAGALERTVETLEYRRAMRDELRQ